MKMLVALGLLSIAVAVPAKAVQHTVSHPPASHPTAVHAQNPYLTHVNHKKPHRHHK